MRLLPISLLLSLLISGCTTPPTDPVEDTGVGEVIIEDTTVMVKALEDVSAKLTWSTQNTGPWHVYYETQDTRSFTARIAGYNEIRFTGGPIGEKIQTVNMDGEPPLASSSTLDLNKGNWVLLSTMDTRITLTADIDTLDVVHEDPTALRLSHSWDGSWNTENEAFAPLAPGLYEGSTMIQTQHQVRMETIIVTTERDVEIQIGDARYTSSGMDHDALILNGTGPVTIQASLWHTREPWIMMWLTDLPQDLAHRITA